LFSSDDFGSSVLVLDLDETSFSVELEKNFSHAGNGVDRSSTEALDEEGFSLIDDDRHFFAHSRLGKEVTSRKGAVEGRS
jgi:hypothetical protein